MYIFSGIIEFAEPSEAKKAFKSMAYKMFHSQPLYLEWAPEDTFSTVKSIDVRHDTEKIIKTDETPKLEPDVKEAEIDDTPPEEDTTLFIKNLNFATREPAVRKHFEKIGEIHSVQVATKPGQNERVSMGYGFIQFKKKITLEKALKTLQLSELEGNKIELKRSHRTMKVDVQRKSTSKSQKQNGTKLMVRNIPFQANDSQLQDIFK